MLASFSVPPFNTVPPLKVLTPESVTAPVPRVVIAPENWLPALLAVMAPTVYPFFDEDVASHVPQLGPVAWTNGYYAKYATALRERSAQLSTVFGGVFTPVMVERALWATRGGSSKELHA